VESPKRSLFVYLFGVWGHIVLLFHIIFIISFGSLFCILGFLGMDQLKQFGHEFGSSSHVFWGSSEPQKLSRYLREAQVTGDEGLE